ncbi:MAG TPA: hypothetical protein VN369_07555 [Terriglobales bacterium]|nr:hypothetical protein [Terriglobales bacterium]
MKKTLFTAWFAVVALFAYGMNFGEFVMGSPSKWYHTALSVLYIVTWYLFILQSGSRRRRLKFSIGWGAGTLAGAVLTLLVNLNDAIRAPGIGFPLIIIFLTPLYGIEAFFTQERFLWASVVNIIVSAGWLVTSAVFLRRIKAGGNC